jgi:hypothetical protein
MLAGRQDMANLGGKWPVCESAGRLFRGSAELPELEVMPLHSLILGGRSICQLNSMKSV